VTWPAAILNVNKFHYLRGGSERYYFDLEAILSERGHRVVSFSMTHPKNRPSPQAARFVPEVSWDGRGSALRALASGVSVIHSRAAAERIDALLDDEPIDVAHLHNIAHQLSPSILGPLRRRRIPVVQTLHDYKLICPNYRLFTEGAPCERCRGGRYWNAYLHRCGRGAGAGSLLLAVESGAHRAAGVYQRGVDLFLAPSRFLLEKAAAFGVPRERLRHVPYPIAVGSEQEEHGAGYFLYAGRLAPEKGILTLLAAAERFRGAAIHIAGDGELRGEVAARAEGLPHVTLHGHLAQDEVARLQRGALAVVVPSEWYENLPLAILEAFAAGKPAVAAAVGGIPELVRDGETGILFAPGDAAGLARALESAAGDPGALAAMGARARAAARAAHDPGRHYAALLAAYAEARDLARAGRAWRWGRAS
jgi:glycosyltransferase involved in cell wall biosynthesis